MYYIAKDFEIKTNTGTDISIEKGSNEFVIIDVNNATGSINIYTEYEYSSQDDIYYVNSIPVCFISSGILQIKEGQKLKSDQIIYTNHYYPADEES